MRCEQLDMLLEWGAEFRRTTLGPTDEEKVLEDQVAFDVILGDLNFDNCSSGTSIFLIYLFFIEGIEQHTVQQSKTI